MIGANVSAPTTLGCNFACISNKGVSICTANTTSVLIKTDEDKTIVFANCSTMTKLNAEATITYKNDASGLTETAIVTIQGNAK